MVEEAVPPRPSLVVVAVVAVTPMPKLEWMSARPTRSRSVPGVLLVLVRAMAVTVVRRLSLLMERP